MNEIFLTLLCFVFSVVTGSDPEEETLGPKLSDNSKGRVIGGAFCLFIGAVGAAGGGIGGGGLYVPLLLMVVGMDAKQAVPVSQACIVGAATVHFLLNTPKKHSFYDRPLTDFGSLLVLEPMLLAGAIFGVLLNQLLPNVVIIVVLTVTLVAGTWRTSKRAKKIYDKEEERKRAGDVERLEPPVSSWEYVDWKSLGYTFALWCIVLLFAVIRGTLPGESSIAGVEYCSGTFWFLTILIPIITALFAAAFGRIAIADSKAKQEAAIEMAIIPESPASRSSISLKQPNISPQDIKIEEKNSEKDCKQKEGDIELQSRGLITGQPTKLKKSASTLDEEKAAIVSEKDEHLNDLAKDEQLNDLAKDEQLNDPPVQANTSPDKADTFPDRESLLPNVPDRESLLSNSVDSVLSEDYKELVWTPTQVGIYMVMGILVGMMAGCLGIGGGLILSPLLLELGYIPAVASAISGMAVVLTSTSALFLYSLSGLVLWEYALIYMPITFTATFIGKLAIDGYAQKHNKQSVIIISVALFLAACAIMMVSQSIIDLAGNASMEFHDVCAPS